MLQNTARDVQPGHWRTASTAATAAFSSLWFAHDRQPRGISARYFPSTGSLAPSGQGRANEVFLLLVCAPMKGGTLWYLCGSHCLSLSLSCRIYLVSPAISTGKQETFHLPDMLFTHLSAIIRCWDIVGCPFMLEVLKDLLYSLSPQA